MCSTCSLPPIPSLPHCCLVQTTQHDVLLDVTRTCHSALALVDAEIKPSEAVTSASLYGRLGKADRGLPRRYLMKATGLSRAQVARLIGQQAATGQIVDRRGGWRRRTSCSASCPGRPPGGDAARVRGVRRRPLRAPGVHLERPSVQPAQVADLRAAAHRVDAHQAVGGGDRERHKSQPNGRPGFARVDSVHQGDLDGRKGVYEFVGAVEAISERFLIPVLERTPGGFPFRDQRLPRRQRLRVRQPPRRRAAGEAPCGSVRSVG